MLEKFISLQNREIRKVLYGWVGGALGVFSGLFWTLSAGYALSASLPQVKNFLGEGGPALVNSLSYKLNLAAGIMALIGGLFIMAAWGFPKPPRISDSSNSLDEITKQRIRDIVEGELNRRSVVVTATLQPPCQSSGTPKIGVLVLCVSIAAAWKILSSRRSSS